MAATSAMWPTESHSSMSRYFRFSTSTESSSWRASTKTPRRRSFRDMLLSFSRTVLGLGSVLVRTLGPRLEQRGELLRQAGGDLRLLAGQEAGESGDRVLVAAAARQADDVDAGR